MDTKSIELKTLRQAWKLEVIADPLYMNAVKKAIVELCADGKEDEAYALYLETIEAHRGC